MSSDAQSLWRTADTFREKSRRLRQEADQLDRAAERMYRLGAALADGCEDGIVEAALAVGRSS